VADGLPGTEFSIAAPSSQTEFSDVREGTLALFCAMRPKD
jgi:hypothetical protein